jgi:hypothetical protein
MKNLMMVVGVVKYSPCTLLTGQFATRAVVQGPTWTRLGSSANGFCYDVATVGGQDVIYRAGRAAFIDEMVRPSLKAQTLADMPVCVSCDL